MSELIKRNLLFLELIVSEHFSDKQLKAVLSHITRNQMKAIREVALNVAKGHLRLNDDARKSLRRHSGKIRLLARRRNLPFKRLKEIVTLPLLKSLIKVSLAPIKKLL